MEESVLSPLPLWETFYLIIGSSAAALTGLQFVVIVLGSETGVVRSSTTRAFGTPTVIHFCAVLLVSAILSAPWRGLAGPAYALGACGVMGVVYGVMVVLRARGQSAYSPVWEDWLWFGAMPVLAYATLLAGAVRLPGHPAGSLFVVGGAAVLLLFVGIHNAWDAVTYIAHSRVRESETPEQES